MKVVKNLTKPSKSWAQVKKTNNATGETVYLVGYVYDHPVHGKYQECLDKIPLIASQYPGSTFEVLKGHPVFEDTLVFKGYHKGQSSFTLQFYASTGQVVDFGPSSTSDLVDGLIQGKGVEIVPLVKAPFGEKIEYRPTADGSNQRVSTPQFFTGNAIKLQFYFQKQGQNIYAQLYTGVE